MRGARNGIRGWPDAVEQAEDRLHRAGDEAGRKARDYVAVARTPQVLAGRLLALAAMAGYADEGAVAQSARSFHGRAVPRALPWADVVVNLIDALSAERLPDHLTEAKRDERAKQREKEAQRDKLASGSPTRVTRSATSSAAWATPQPSTSSASAAEEACGRAARDPGCRRWFRLAMRDAPTPARVEGPRRAPIRHSWHRRSRSRPAEMPRRLRRDRRSPETETDPGRGRWSTSASSGCSRWGSTLAYVCNERHLPDEERTRLRRMMGRHAEEWIDLVATLRGDLSYAEARVLTQAVFRRSRRSRSQP
jgi:hypothetical protein